MGKLIILRSQSKYLFRHYKWQAVQGYLITNIGAAIPVCLSINYYFLDKFHLYIDNNPSYKNSTIYTKYLEYTKSFGEWLVENITESSERTFHGSASSQKESYARTCEVLVLSTIILEIINLPVNIGGLFLGMRLAKR